MHPRMFQNLLDPADRDALLARVGRLTPESRPLWGRMTVGGMLCHLVDGFDVCTGARKVGNHTSLLSTTLLRFVALTAPIRFPKSTRTAPEMNQEVRGTPPGEFEGDRARLLDTVERFVSGMDPARWHHPLFGRLTRGEWGRWAWRHMDHHLRQFGV